MAQAEVPQPEKGFYVVVTGANSGLGLGFGTRLIDEFLQTRPQSETLVLIITTRDQRKGDATIAILENHVQQICREVEQRVPGMSMVLQRRVQLRQERLDLLSLLSVQKLSKKLRETTPKLDAVVCNAGIGGWTGLNWPCAVWSVLTGIKNATTYPTYKMSGLGWLAKPQLPQTADGKKMDEPPLGEVFCANIFGHHLLGHYLAPLLARHSKNEHTRGRLIYVSSLEAYRHLFDMNDMQGLASSTPYEGTKRLTDLLGMSSRLAATEPLVNRYLDYDPPPPNTVKPRIYVSHPGVCGTAIIPLIFILEWCMVASFYLARWFGSQWHPIWPEKGACSMVWLTLAEQSTLDTMEEREGVGKWGSATDMWGNERVERTEVDGWGWGGKIGEKIRRGRNPYAKTLTEADREEFERLGKQCWEEMESLRVDWEKRLEAAGVAIEMA